MRRMDTLTSLNWMKEHNLTDLAKEASQQLRKIFFPCLGIQNEKILIIGDIGSRGKYVSPVLAGGYYYAAESLNLNAKLILQESKVRGTEADIEVQDAIAELREKNVIVTILSDKLGGLGKLGKSFRKFCYSKKHRFVSAPSLGRLDTSRVFDILKAIDINYKPLQAQHAEIKKQLDEASELHATTSAGTDLLFNIEGAEAVASDGNYVLPGKGGNLPAGEVFIPPNGKKVEGKVVIDVSSRTIKGTCLVKDPVTLTIKNGSIVNIEGKEEAQELEQTLKWAATKAKYPYNLRRISEFGIGLNPNASVIGATIVDEKTKGTAHIAIGSNYWFGGDIYAFIHLDQIFNKPEIRLDGKLLKID